MKSMEHGAQIAVSRAFVPIIALCKICIKNMSKFWTNSPMPHAPCPMQKYKLLTNV